MKVSDVRAAVPTTLASEPGPSLVEKEPPQAGGIPANVLQGYDNVGLAFQQRNMLNTLTAAVNPNAVLSGVAANEKKQVAELDQAEALAQQAFNKLWDFSDPNRLQNAQALMQQADQIRTQVAQGLNPQQRHDLYKINSLEWEAFNATAHPKGGILGDTGPDNPQTPPQLLMNEAAQDSQVLDKAIYPQAAPVNVAGLDHFWDKQVAGMIQAEALAQDAFKKLSDFSDPDRLQKALAMMQQADQIRTQVAHQTPGLGEELYKINSLEWAAFNATAYPKGGILGASGPVGPDGAPIGSPQMLMDEAADLSQQLTG